MNFRKWLILAEAGTTRVRPTAQSVSDRANLYGQAALFGHKGTIQPISAGINNQAFAAVAAGVGSGVNKALADSGFDPSPLPQINILPTRVKALTQQGSLPLQLPFIPSKNLWIPGFNVGIMQSYEADIAEQVYKQVQNPDSDPRVRRIGDDPKNRDKFATLKQMPGGENLYGLAKNFTRALIKISIILKMREQGLDKTYNLKGTLGKEQESDGNLISVFYFEKYQTVDQEEVKE